MILYPKEYELNENHGYPTEEDFKVLSRESGKGIGVYTKRAFSRGQFVARITGNIVPEVGQHTLQMTPTTHLHDLYFTGFLLHSCAPNIYLDMTEFEVWALRDIEAGEPLTMDYASTEDTLYQQFPCLCGTAECRQWITGRKEEVSKEGEEYLEKLAKEAEQNAHKAAS